MIKEESKITTKEHYKRTQLRENVSYVKYNFKKHLACKQQRIYHKKCNFKKAFYCKEYSFEKVFYMYAVKART